MDHQMTTRIGALLGNIAPAVFTTGSIRPLDVGDDTHELVLNRHDGVAVRAFMTGWTPTGTTRPAVLYIHAHGGKYNIGASELLAGRPALMSPYGPALAQHGTAALCIDLPCFGSRATETESAAAKRHLWHGTTLFGEMLADLAGALDWLQAQDGIDPDRIGALGLSMGATLGFWLAALERRIRAVAHLCCFADLATLVELGAHDRHGPYMTVPGLLPLIRTGQLAGLVAPRPQLACMGSEDALTPPLAIERGLADLTAAYNAASASENLSTLIEPVGHVETPAMRAAVLNFLAKNLGSAAH